MTLIVLMMYVTALNIGNGVLEAQAIRHVTFIIVVK